MLQSLRDRPALPFPWFLLPFFVPAAVTELNKLFYLVWNQVLIKEILGLMVLYLSRDL